MTDSGRTEHGDVIMTEDGAIFVAHRSHAFRSATGIMLTDGDIAYGDGEAGFESPVDLCVGYRTLTDDEVRTHRDRIGRILSAEQDGLQACASDAKVRGDAQEFAAYSADLDSLDDAARIIAAKFAD